MSEKSSGLVQNLMLTGFCGIIQRTGPRHRSGQAALERTTILIHGAPVNQDEVRDLDRRLLQSKMSRPT